MTEHAKGSRLKCLRQQQRWEDAMEHRDRMTRRRALALGVGALCMPSVASAEAWRQKTVRFVVAFPAGGAADIVARILAERLTQVWGQSVVVENRAGAGGNIAGNEVARATPDGATLLITSQSVAVNRFLYAKMPFDPVTDLVPVSMAMAVPNVMVVPAASPDRSVAEFIARAKANHGKLNFGSAGVGTSIHLAGELFKQRAGIDILHVPYRGAAPALTDLVGGRLDVMFDTLTVSQSQIHAGTIRALGVTSRERASALPEIPPVGETLPGFDVNSWFAFLAPKGTPADAAAALSSDIAGVLNQMPVMQRLAELGARAVGSSPAALAEAMRTEAVLWEPIIRAASMRIDE
jgi:tripartite-type tricarboxylate transporter receptor subunit TctC